MATSLVAARCCSSFPALALTSTPETPEDEKVWFGLAQGNENHSTSQFIVESGTRCVCVCVCVCVCPNCQPNMWKPCNP